MIVRKRKTSTHPAGNVVNHEMIQSRIERLLMSDYTFRAVVRLINATIALAVHNAPASDEQCQMK